ncbi:MAG: shikimate kinase [Muribaculaceae bacterium]|nr:shikimate kinase [Muribaculaceae bacterium]
MASGKSTLGSALAAAVPGLDFIDLDAAVEAEAGCSIAEIFARSGEEAFRAIEADMLRRVCRRGSVIACGGGTPCRKANMDFMLSAGTVVRLDADVDTIVRRLLEAPEGSRPLVDAFRSDPAALTGRVRTMLGERADAYSRAHAAFDANLLDTAEQVAGSVARFRLQFIDNHH